MINELFAVISPILFCAGLGYVWARRGLDYPVEFITRVVMNIGAPCLIVSSFNQAGIEAARLGKIAAAAAVVLLIMGLVGIALIRALKLDRKVFLPPLLFGNIGNMGLPLSLFAFGDAGLALGLAIFLLLFTLHMSLGLTIVAGRRDAAGLLRQPVLWATVFAVSLALGNWSLPAWLANTTGLLGDVTIPLMLITLGVSLANLQVTEWKHSLLFSALRVGGGFGLGVLVAEWFGLEGAERGVLILQSSMPVAVFNYLLALRYERDPGEVAAMVVMSTLLAFLVLPLIVAFVLF